MSCFRTVVLTVWPWANSATGSTWGLLDLQTPGPHPNCHVSILGWDSALWTLGVLPVVLMWVTCEQLYLRDTQWLSNLLNSGWFSDCAVHWSYP